MSGFDKLVVGVLLAIAIVLMLPQVRRSGVGKFFAGECGASYGGGRLFRCNEIHKDR